MAQEKPAKRLVVVVTGANSGIGFGICHRFLLQLARPNPPDADPFVNPWASDDERGERPTPIIPLTLIMACRNRQRAEEARATLLVLLDRYVAKQRRPSLAYDFAVEFQQSVEVAVHIVDLTEIRSVLRFSKEVSQKYQYISHLIFNAGLAPYSHISFGTYWAQVWNSPLRTIHAPKFNVQHVGSTSADKMGLAWQSNIFGHYMMYRSLEPLLLAYMQRTSLPPRVLWESSLDAHPDYDPEDWQLLKTDLSYQASKAQLDLIVLELQQRAQKVHSDAEIRHIIVTPGICDTNIAASLLGPPLFRFAMCAFFYIVRMLGSQHISFSPYCAAAAIVHMALVDIMWIPAAMGNKPSTTLKFSTLSSRLGYTSVGAWTVRPWEEHPDEGARLLGLCEGLYQSILEQEDEAEVEMAAKGL